MANDVVLVPNYSDPMDSVANEIIQGLYPNRVVVGINCQNILLWGGMVHCVTQQQPLGSSLMSFNDHSNHAETEEPVILFDLMGVGPTIRNALFESIQQWSRRKIGELGVTRKRSRLLWFDPQGFLRKNPRIR